MSVSYQTVLETVFAESLCDDWCVEILEALAYSYKEAYAHCSRPRFGDPEAHDTRSHYLRGLFETKLREISLQYDGMTAESRSNKTHSYSHTWVKSGNLYLTASAVTSPNSKPRQADFRNIYQSNGQLELFEDQEKADKENLIYAILLYGTTQTPQPSFVRIAFPSRHWKSYVESIDLMARYPDTIRTEIPIEETDEPIVTPRQPEEVIQEPQKPRIRPLPKRAGGTKE